LADPAAIAAAAAAAPASADDDDEEDEDEDGVPPGADDDAGAPTPFFCFSSSCVKSAVEPVSELNLTGC
jgi:hypothetical protein